MHKIKISDWLFFICIPFLLLFPLSLHAFDFTTGVSEFASTESNKSPYTVLNAGFLEEGKHFSFIWDLQWDTEEKWGESFHGDYYGAFSTSILKAGLVFHTDDLYFSIGKFQGKDVIDSPYSLFLNPACESLPSMNLSYEGEHFLYRERWMGLTYNSDYGWEDRGAVFKTYAVKAGGFRFGFEDVSVSSGEYLNPIDVISPAPSFYNQYIALSANRPWTEDSTSNANSIMGFFSDYRTDAWYIYAQILVDDFNANRFFHPNLFQDQDKVAISLGGTWDAKENLKLGLYMGFATKYTFQSFGGVDGSVAYDTQYGYTIYPANAYYANGTWNGISVEDNTIGYCNGENNLSIMLSADSLPLKHQAKAPSLFREVAVHSELELSITGEQSPGNPWMEGEQKSDMASGLRFLDDSELNKKITLTTKAVLPVKHFTVTLFITFGYEWNTFDLNAATGSETNTVNGQPWWVPGDDNALIAELGLSLFYTFRY